MYVEQCLLKSNETPATVSVLHGHSTSTAISVFCLSLSLSLHFSHRIRIVWVSVTQTCTIWCCAHEHRGRAQYDRLYVCLFSSSSSSCGSRTPNKRRLTCISPKLFIDAPTIWAVMLRLHIIICVSPATFVFHHIYSIISYLYELKSMKLFIILALKSVYYTLEVWTHENWTNEWHNGMG